MTSRISYHRRIVAGPSVAAAIAVAARQRDPAILDSADLSPGQGRYTVLGIEPIRLRSTPSGGTDPFESLRHELRRTMSSIEPAPSDLPLTPGWMGYFAYEAGAHVERVPLRPAPPASLPIARWALYDTLAIHDDLTHEWSIIAADLRSTDVHAPSPASRIDQWKRLLSQAREPLIPPAPQIPGELVDDLSIGEYLDRVARTKSYIAAGDIFQVNLARRFHMRQTEPALDTYLRLRKCNPAAYAAFFSWDSGQTAILSASPELYLQLRGREVLTRPIKGTRPRSVDPIVDDSLRQDLLASSKDAAELAMIVDLERNDLGRVCEFGSVLVQASAGAHPFAELESHPTVHHLVASVAGTLREDCDGVDLLRATFPGGSITGAPKVRAMEIIRELEPVDRGVYTGAIGHIGLDGGLTLNIAIRTLIAHQGCIVGYVGSGIVADSDPLDEYAETVAKAAGLCRALGFTRSCPIDV